MPLIIRTTEDMFEFQEVMDIMVNPVNLKGVSGAGLALEFRKRVPDHIEPYKELCRTGDLRIGTVKLLDNTGHNWSMLLFPTKRHFMDTSSPDDIKRGLMALRELLKEDKYRYSSVGMPMLGCGCGQQDYDVVYPMMQEYLSDLDATVFLSMSPSKTPMRPRYLVIVGPLDFGITQEQQEQIDQAIGRALELRFQTKLEDYTGIVSGGMPGVDDYIGGTDFMENEQATWVWCNTQRAPLVVKPNNARFQLGASLHQGNLLGEIGDDILLIKPPGHNNNRMSAIQEWVKTNNLERERDGLLPRRIAIMGEASTQIVTEALMLPDDGVSY